MDLQNTDVKEIAKYFSDKVNNFLFQPQPIAIEQKNSSDMKDLDHDWIKLISGNTYKTDARNEHSANLAKSLVTVPFIQKRIAKTDNSRMEEVAKIMSCEHKTLQQTFSSLVFYHLQITCSEQEQQVLSNKYGADFYRLPLI